MRGRIAFASGKGGTGKTTFAVNVAYLLSLSSHHVQFLDLDVEEPNAHIFLNPEIEETHPVRVWIPKINYEKCKFCGLCAKNCQFRALVVFPKEIMLFESLCKSCKLCKRVCEYGAIEDGEREVGVVRKGRTAYGISFVGGIVNVREPMPVPVINKVKEFRNEESIQIIDAPPGTSCPFVKSTYDADFLVLVTEPTPFGLHDLKLCIDFAKGIGKKIGVVINRKNGSFLPLYDYVQKESIPILVEIPEDLKVAKAYSEGKLILEVLPEYRAYFEELIKKIMGFMDE